MNHLKLSTIFYKNPFEFIKEQAGKYSAQKMTREKVLFSGDFIFCIFEFLLASTESLGRASSVCKEWKQLMSDNFLWKNLPLKTLFPNMKILNTQVWDRHVYMSQFELDATGEFIQDKQMIKKLKRFSSLLIEGDAGITLLTIPKGLTFNKLVELGKFPKEGPAVRFHYKNLLEELQDVPVNKTYRVAITNNVLQGSRNLSVSDQQDLLDILGCRMLEMMSVMTLIVLTYISSFTERPPIRLYNDNPETFTRCVEQVDNSNLAIGGYAADGICIGSSSASHAMFGVGVVKECD